MSRRLPTLFVAVATFLLPGCSYLCRFEARGSVLVATTGQPIAGAKVELIDSEGYALTDATSTDAQGAFELKFKTSPSAARERTGWKLILTSDGFEPEKIDTGTVKEPQNANETVYLIFRITMRKSR